MSSEFETLPTEILQDVCAILDTDHPTSLLAFALANKHCYSVASTVLFRTVKLAIPDSEGGHAPFQFVEGLQTRLLRDDAFKHVRRLILCPAEHSSTQGDWPYTTLEPCERAFKNDTGLNSCWDVFTSQWRDRNRATIAERDWEPVLRLVERLSGLADLYWICHERLPLRLLQALDSKMRLCRLHHYNFKLESPTGGPLTSYDQALIASPSLYSIGNIDEHIAGLQTARSIRSPNLKRVYLVFDCAAIPRDDIRGHEHQNVRYLVPREVIDMDGWGGVPVPLSIVRAEALGDWSALRVLALHHPIDAHDLPPPGDFPLLDTLTYNCGVDANLTPWDKLSDFLRNLPRLGTLEMIHWHRSVSFTPALNSNLRTLTLNTWDIFDGPRLRNDHIHQLPDLCPNIESLDIEIRRSRGDASEVACYRSLGRLLRLQELCIHLDASPPLCIPTSADGPSDATYDTAIGSWFDKQDAEYLPGSLKPYRQGHVRDALINLAIDEDLARAIFQVINSTKLISRGELSMLPLEWLSLGAGGPVYSPISDDPRFFWYLSPLNSFTVALGQQWTIERDIRDDAREVLHADRVDEYQMFSDQEKADFEELKDDPYWFPIWRRVWPAEKEGVDWWEDWKSYPLALGDGGNNQAD